MIIETSTVHFHIRYIFDFAWLGPVAKDAVTMQFEEVAKLPEAQKWIPEELSMCKNTISTEMEERGLPFEFTGSAIEDASLSLKVFAKHATKTLLAIRRGIAHDAHDHRRFARVEIRQIGPELGVNRVYGTKGPERSGIDGSQQNMKPAFDADGIDANSYFPIELQDYRHGDHPEVRLEFNDFTELLEVLDMEDPPDFGGNDLGYEMEDVIDRKKLATDYTSNCDSDTVLFHFKNLEEAVRVAEYFSKTFTNRQSLRRLLKRYC